VSGPNSPAQGKVENGVRYVQRSFIAGREFVDIEEANRKLIDWVVNEAGVRDHGTTHEAPLARFAEAEAAALLELPARPFELVRVTQGTVARDTFIALDGSYYQRHTRLWVGSWMCVYTSGSADIRWGRTAGNTREGDSQGTADESATTSIRRRSRCM